MKRGRDLLLTALLAAPLLLAALWPVRGPLSFQLDLGPGDAPYVQGFAPRSEVENSVGVHWSGPAGRMSLPLELSGDARVTVRLSRILHESAEAAIVFAGAPIDRFATRGGTVVERGGRVALPAFVPATVSLRVSSADEKGRSLRLDWLRFDLGQGSRARLRGLAVLRPALLMLVFYGVLRLAGVSPTIAAGVVAPWALAAIALLRTNPWLEHRLLTALPESLAGLGLVLVAIGRSLERRGVLGPGDTRWVVAAASCAYVLRGAALNHPGYWFPDLHSHASLAEVVRDAGWAFFGDPAASIRRWGIGVHDVFGQQLAVPYSAAFHLIFALLPVSIEDMPGAMRLFSAALCSVPILAVAVLARRFGASPACVILLPVAPVYGVRLALALLPALFGHAVDSVFLAWFGRRLPRLAEPRMAMLVVLWMLACQLSYVSAVVILPVFLACVAILLLVESPPRVRLALSVLAAGALGSVLAIVLYYWSFAPFLMAAASHVVGAPGSSGGGAGSGFLTATLGRLVIFYPPLFILLAGIGLVGLARKGADARVFLGGWALAYLALLVCRAALPGVFGHVHEELFAAPLFCLGAGDCMACMARGRGLLRLAAAAAFLALAFQGLAAQWESFLDQFGYLL